MLHERFAADSATGLLGHLSAEVSHRYGMPAGKTLHRCQHLAASHTFAEAFWPRRLMMACLAVRFGTVSNLSHLPGPHTLLEQT